MKTLIFLLSLATTAHGYDGFHCIPSLRQTRLQVLVKDFNVELLVVNAGGYAFMPQFDSGGAQFSLSFNKMQAEDLAGLSEAFIFSWPKEKCSVDSTRFVVDCSGEAAQTVNGIKTYGISTTEVTEKTRDALYEKRKFRMSAEKDNIYFVNMEFYVQSCEKFK